LIQSHIDSTHGEARNLDYSRKPGCIGIKVKNKLDGAEAKARAQKVVLDVESWLDFIPLGNCGKQ